MASRCGRFYTPIPTYLIPKIFPLRVSLLPHFVCDSEADVGFLIFGRRSSDDKGDVKAEPSSRAFATDKIFLFHCRFTVYFIGVEPCLSPSSSALCGPRNEPDILRALNAKKNVSTMKTERSYHPQNRFETKRRLLALPQKIVWIVVCIVALKAIGVSEELTAILMLFAFVYLIRATLQIAFRLLFFLIRWICIAAALAWIVCRLLL